jgi:hypothetical protein
MLTFGGKSLDFAEKTATDRQKTAASDDDGGKRRAADAFSPWPPMS